MDPDTALEKARRAVAEMVEAGDCGSSAAADLLDAFESLDHWMTAGGFAPAAWGEQVLSATLDEDAGARERRAR